MKLKAFIAGLLAAALASPALADEPRQVWSGFYIGAHGGLDTSSAEASIPTFLTIDGLSSNGAAFGVHMGADWQMPNSRIVLGIGGDYTWSDSDFTVSITGIGSVLRAGIDESWAIYARAGYDMGRVMPYVLAGYSNADVSASIIGLGSASDSMKGWLVGGGMEIAVSPGFFVGAEYRYTQFDTIEVIPTLLDLDTDRHEVRATFKYKFGGHF